MKSLADVLASLSILVSTGLSAQTQPPPTLIRVGPPPAQPPSALSSPELYAFAVNGDLQIDGTIFKDGQPFLHTDGGDAGSAALNTSVGIGALMSLTVEAPYSGTRNTASGALALHSNTTGRGNTGVGSKALYGNTEGTYNTALGTYTLASNTTGSLNTGGGALALFSNYSGSRNTALGHFALFYSTVGSGNTATGNSSLLKNDFGSYNTASGDSSLKNSYGGSRNVAFGFRAGYENRYGSDNIWISSYGVYPGTESNTLRIGNGTGTGYFQQDRAFISGIRNAVGVFDQSVCIDLFDQLGPCTLSSARFKTAVEDMANASEALFGLRPVRFRYLAEMAGKTGSGVHFGLIAEEVARLFPGLVTYDAKGEPISVRYEALTPLLLNELQKQRREMRLQRLLVLAALAGLLLVAARLVRSSPGARADAKAVE